jgi:anti-sigma factor RsiW
MKSECSEYQKKIARSLLGDLDAAEMQTLEEHLAACSHCRSEQANYAQTLDLLKLADEDAVPRHFFVDEKEQIPNPWQLFCRMKPGWQAATAAIAALFLLIGIADLSRLQTRSGPDGLAVSFGGMDVEALKGDILKSAEEQSRKSRNAWIQELRAEIERSNATLTRQQQAYLATELQRLSSRLSQRITRAEGNARTDAQGMVADMYQTVSRQRAQDLSIMDVRFDSIEAKNAVKTQQTEDILDTLLQVAELKLR